MKCLRVKELLSEYIDGALDAGTVALLENHVTTCRNCREELAILKTVIKDLGSTEKTKAPADFLQKVHERLERRSEFERVMRKLFVPVRVKVPLEVAGVLATVILIVLVSNNVRLTKEEVFQDRSAAPVKFAEQFKSQSKVMMDEKAIEPAVANETIELTLLISPEESILGYATIESEGAAEKDKLIRQDAALETKEVVRLTGKSEARSLDVEKALLPPPDLNKTLFKLEDLIKLTEGKIIFIERDKQTAAPQFIAVEIPLKNYAFFVEKLSKLGKISRFPPTPTQEAKTKDPVNLRIKLVPAE
ncbi:MAG: DUF2275 domain-containing protein [Candidatus Omnitrophota bacterium]